MVRQHAEHLLELLQQGHHPRAVGEGVLVLLLRAAQVHVELEGVALALVETALAELHHAELAFLKDVPAPPLAGVLRRDTPAPGGKQSARMRVKTSFSQTVFVLAPCW